MSWFKVDDRLHSHPKAMRAGTQAMGLWVLAGSWCASQETDGWVPEYLATRLDPQALEHAEALVRARLWEAGERDGEAGWRFLNWDEFQPLRADLEAKRADNRERMRRARTQGGDVRAHNTNSAPAVTPTPTRPDPTPNNTSASATADREFGEFWSAYPKKKAKGQAVRAYVKARKKVDHATIMAALTTQAGEWSGKDPQFLPYPATWLNGERWADEPTTPNADTQPTPLRRTHCQCDNPEPHDRHDWSWKRNDHVCLGVPA